MRGYTLIAFLFLASLAHATDTLNLAGSWRFRMDHRDEGEAQRWFAQRLPGMVRLPGSMMENGKGDPLRLDTKWTASIYDSSWFFDPRMAKYRQPGNLKFPFWLNPPNYYVGAAWYQRDIIIPPQYNGRHLVLSLERPHSETTVWVDDKPLGQQYGFSTAQEFDCSGLTPGRHTLTLRIDNRIKAINVGPDSHSLTDQTQGNWNGVVGSLLLISHPATYIEDIQVFPDIAHNNARVRIKIHGAAGQLTLSATSFNTNTHQRIPPLTVPYTGDSATIDLPMGDHPLLWAEFHPALYRLTVKLSGGDTKTIEFGMREIQVSGTHFILNGRPIHLRGMVENCEFPLTGYPPMDEPSWERLFRKARAYGLNHMRFHSYCPPEAAFRAADRVGFYLQPEGPSWANHGSSLGDGKPVDRFLWAEIIRLVNAYGNHASFCMLAYGNEPRGGHHAEWLTRFVDYWKAADKRRVYTGADVGGNWPLVPDNDYMVKSGPRGLNWSGLPEAASDYESVVDKFPVPYVTHEMGQWCAYPDLTEIPKYTGVYKAKNFEIFRDDLQQQGMADEAHRFLMASGKLQALCYKAEIEKSLRTEGSAGFQLLCLTDYSGQGTALVGVLNALWQEKGYMQAGEWSRFCNSTVPLALLPKFVYNNTDTLVAPIEIYHYGENDILHAVIDWTLRDDHQTILAKGALAPATISAGGLTTVGHIAIPLQNIHQATHTRLTVTIRNTKYANDWDCWVYPAQLPATHTGIYYCTQLNDSARRILDAGGKVFLNAAGRVVKGKEVVMNFTPVFWNTSWFKMRPPHTLGILVDTSKAAFTQFPTSYHSDFQWWDILYKAQVMHLEDFPKSFRPLVQPIDTWFLNRRLGLIFEARVGKGRLIVSSADLGPDIPATRPASRQLYYSIMRYMQSPNFQPKTPIDYTSIDALFSTLIDRHALISRHNPVNTTADTLGALSIGNGRFAFTVDITGLQSFPEAYDKGIPLGTQSEWGWHSFPNTNNYNFDETLKKYKIHGRDITYSVQGKNKAVDYFRANPHRLQLGNIGLELTKQDGTPAKIDDLKNIHQELILWTGEIKSHFTLEGIPVDVSTVADPDSDAIAIKIISPLLRQNKIKIRLRFPYPTNAFTDNGDNWQRQSDNQHTTQIINSTNTQTLIKHQLDTTTYFIQATYTNAKITQPQTHYYLITPITTAAAGAGKDSFEITTYFSPLAPTAGPAVGMTRKAHRMANSTNPQSQTKSMRSAVAYIPDGPSRRTDGRSRRTGGPSRRPDGPSRATHGPDEATKRAAQAWQQYWTQTAAIDFTGSTDPRAPELERRIILSQYLTRIQDAGDYPPQETGLTYNSWYGRPHLEMHWWHAAHFALYNQPQLLERSLDWYFHAAANAEKLAERQGYKGVRWQKMTDPDGTEGPSSVGAFLIWQQPHFIYLAELAYRAAKDEADKESIIKKYGKLVEATADFMASYAWYDSTRGQYILGPELIPAQERFKADSTINPIFELAYWRWALQTAQEWRSRQGKQPNTKYLQVEAHLSPLPKADSLYYPTESATDAYTNPRYRGDHPVVLATFGFLPGTAGLDTTRMKKTFDWVWNNWDWPSTWGWDYPLVAMTATRLGLPEKAIDALLMPVQKNTYLPDGHNYQDDRLKLYLPGNGGLLAAIALMCAGYDGCTEQNPGIPKNGKWKVKWEGLKPLP